MTEHYFDGSLYPGNFQPSQSVYDGFPTTAEQTWVDAFDDLSYALPPFYDDSYPPTNPSYPHTDHHNLISPEALQLIPMATCISNSTHPTTFENPFDLPCYSQECTPQYIQPVDNLPSHNVLVQDIAVSTPKKPVIAIMPQERRSSDASIPAKEFKTNKKRRTRDVIPVRSASEKEINSLTPKRQAGTRSLEDCMGLFDSKLKATKETRRRKAFTAQEKKAVQSVRSIGACIPCRFRKKTCSTGRPCPYCTRVTGNVSLGAQLCHRESPFIDRSVTRYYYSTSKKRIIDFQLFAETLRGVRGTISIDGVGPVTYPLRVRIIQVSTSNLAVEDMTEILRTVHQDVKPEGFTPLSDVVHLLESGSLSMAALEQWAFEYVCKFAKTMNSVATGFVFGVEYALKGLPYADLVRRVSRLFSLNFVIRAGILILPNKCGTTSFRTIQAQIDTLLFQAFQTNERALHRDLQHLIFRSAGSLSRDAIIPVCLCVWQLARLQCMLASQVTNLAARDMKRNREATPTPLSPSPSCPSLSPTCSTSSMASNSSNSGYTRSYEAESLKHGLNLLLCTFEALFRSACPLLLDWNDGFNQGLLGNDEGLLRLAEKMGRTIRRYRDRGHSRRFRLGMGYHKEMSDRIRGLMRER